MLCLAEAVRTGTSHQQFIEAQDIVREYGVPRGANITERINAVSIVRGKQAR